MIHPTAIIGQPPQVRARRTTREPGFWPVVSPHATVEAFVTVDAGTIRPTYIGPDVWLMKTVHVGHDATILHGCELAPGTVIGGHAELGPGVKCGIGALILPRRKVGAGARIGAGAVVTKDVPPGETWVGNPARPLVKERATGVVLTPSEEEGWQELALRAGVAPEWVDWFEQSRKETP